MLALPICNIGKTKLDNGIVKYELKKKTIECDKNTVICDIGTTQCDDGIIKYEKKKIRIPSNVTKVRSKVMLILQNVRIEPSNVRKR